MTSSGSTSAHYYYVEQIASGGMGRVSLVLRRENAFRRLYAIKRLHAHLRDDPDVRAMFVDEARLAGLISHPNVVSVTDVGEDTEGPFLVMDYVDGVGVDGLLRAETVTAATLPVTVALEIVEQVARGLHAAHELRDHGGRFLGLVHRDVSPQNILVGHDGVVRVADFGIAKALDRASRTNTGVLKGKLGYASPEQLRYEAIDRRSDLFALGVVLYELLTGERLYGSADLRGPSRILSEPPPDVGAVRSGLPPELVELAYELLAKDREDRPATAGEVAERVRLVRESAAALEDEPVTLESFMASRFASAAAKKRAMIATANERLERGELPLWPVTPMTPVSPAPRRRAIPLYAVALLMLVAGLGIGALAFGGASFGSRAAEPPTEEPAAEAPGPAPVPTGLEAGESAATDPEVEPKDETAVAASSMRRIPARRRARPSPSAGTRARDEPSEAPREEPAEEPRGTLTPWTFDGMR